MFACILLSKMDTKLLHNVFYVLECWETFLKNTKQVYIWHLSQHQIKPAIPTETPAAGSKVCFAQLRSCTVHVSSVGSQDLLFITYFHSHPCYSWNHKGARRDMATETGRGKIKVLRTISISKKERQIVLDWDQIEPSLCCQWWHENTLKYWLLGPESHPLLSCNAQLWKICSIRPSSHPFIPPTSSS